MKIIGDVPWAKMKSNTDIGRALKRTYEVMNIPHGELSDEWSIVSFGGGAAGGYWPAYMFGDGEVGEKISPFKGIPIVGGGAGLGGRAHAANEYYVIEGAGKVYGMAGAEKAVATLLYAFAGKIPPKAAVDEQVDDCGSESRKGLSRRRSSRPRLAWSHPRRRGRRVRDDRGTLGIGKSTFMHIVGCLDRPTRGGYALDSHDVSGLSDDELARVRNETIGFVFQGSNLLARTSAMENVELPLLYTRTGALRASERRERARRALAAVGLSDREEHLPSQLSGGQQQRVAIARALVNNPRLLLADEPTGNLDTTTSHEVMEVFARLRAEQGITVMVITHERDIAAWGTRTIDFRDGRIVSDRLNDLRVTPC